MEDNKRPVVAVSGGFDPVTSGHVAMILDAAKIGDVVVLLNSDEWCARKRWTGSCFLPWERRRLVLMEIPGGKAVWGVDDADDTVCAALEELKPDYFGNGADRTVENTPEVSLCKKMGIGTLWFLGSEVTPNTREIRTQAIQNAFADEKNYFHY